MEAHNKFLVYHVEDDRLMHFLVKRKIFDLREDCEIRHFTNGEDFLKDIDRKPEILILDFELPGLNGMEVLERVKMISPATKVIMLSSHDEESLVNIFESAGIVRFLKKNDNSLRDLSEVLNETIYGIYMEQKMIRRRESMLS